MKAEEGIVCYQEGGDYMQKLLTIAIRVLPIAVATASAAGGLVFVLQIEIAALPARGFAGIAAVTASL